MSTYFESEKTSAVTEVQPQPPTEKNEQLHSVTESPATGSQDQPGEQQQESQEGRFRQLFRYMRTRDFWLLILLG